MHEEQKTMASEVRLLLAVGKFIQMSEIAWAQPFQG